MGAVSSIIFAKRNIDKAANGDIGRAPIPVFQTLGAVVGTAELASGAGLTKVSSGINNIFSKTDTLFGKTGVTKKVCTSARSLVNPLLCGASAIRVLKDEDKKSALIEEGCAMASMFAGEKLIKRTTKAISKSISSAAPLQAQLDFKLCQSYVKNLHKKDFNSIVKAVSCSSKYGKIIKLAGFVFADLALVSASIFCFDMGKKIGKKITGRDKKEQVAQVQNIQKQPTQPSVKMLAVKA